MNSWKPHAPRFFITSQVNIHSLRMKKDRCVTPCKFSHWSFLFCLIPLFSQVDIGNGVKVKNKRMEQNFVDNKLNLEKAAKNLTAMAWTHAERLERSLEGGRSNKYPDAKPKQQATPKKVNAVLGNYDLSFSFYSHRFIFLLLILALLKQAH